MTLRAVLHLLLRERRERGQVHFPAKRHTTPRQRPTDTTQMEAGHLGRWTGVEGMDLVVASTSGGVTLDMQWRKRGQAHLFKKRESGN